MKKMLLTVFGVLFLYQIAFAAISGSTVWEVRTTGNAANGGGFVTGASGTDYSQQDAEQYALTGCTTAAANAIILNANAAANMVGNICQVISGTNFTAGFYEIKSVVAGVSITVDRNCTTGAGALGVINIGGGVASTATIASVVGQGNKIYIKSGTYNESLTCQVSGDTSGTIRWIGYNTTHGDTPSGTNRPLFDAQSTRATGVFSNSKKFNFFYYLRAANSTGMGFDLSSENDASTNVAYFCKSSSNGGAGFSSSNGGGNAIFSCESNNNATGTNLNSIYCYAHDNTGYGISTTGTIVGNISESNGGNGFTFNAGAYQISHAYNNIAYNNTGSSSDGFAFNTGAGYWRLSIINNISMNNGRYGFNIYNSADSLFDYNSYYGNATAGLNGMIAGSHDITTDPLFTAPTANPPDFTLQSASPCKDKGFPNSTWAASVGLATGSY